jgi:hypothetical protein
MSGKCTPFGWMVFIVLIASMEVSFVRGESLDSANAASANADSPEQPFVIDFSGYTGGTVDQWLIRRGYKLERDAKNRSLLGLSINDRALELTANGRLTGFILNDSINLDKVHKVRVEWGIRRYPQETSYERKVNNEALMLYFFFGKEKMPSGHILIPDSPYFIGLFLCQDEQVNVPYKGRYFHTGGRFVCLGKPSPGETVDSEFDLDREFKSYFGKQQTPGVTGIGLGIDTSKAGQGGKAGAYLRSIEFF